MFEVNIYLQQSHHGIRPASGEVCGVVEYRTQKGSATWTFLHKEENITAHRLALTGITKALGILKKPCEIHISTDDDYIVDMWEQGLPEKWQENGWRKANGKEIKNKDLWRELKNAPHSIDMRVFAQKEYEKWKKQEMDRKNGSAFSKNAGSG